MTPAAPVTTTRWFWWLFIGRTPVGGLMFVGS